MSKFPLRRKTLAANLSGGYKVGHVFALRIVTFLTLFAHPLLGGVVLDGSFGTKGHCPVSTTTSRSKPLLENSRRQSLPELQPV